MGNREAKTSSKRMGRPPGRPDKIRNRRVVTMVTGQEFERLTKIADTSGKSLSAVVHQLVVSGLQQPNALNQVKGKK